MIQCTFNYQAVLFTKDVERYRNLLKIRSGKDFRISPQFVINNLDYDSVYYMLYNGKLTAFKIKAFSFHRDRYLIQTPSSMEWVEFSTYSSVIFKSKEDYFSYLENKCSPIELKNELINPLDLPYFRRCVGCSSSYLTNAYKWSIKEAKPKKEDSYIIDVIFLGDSFVVFYELCKDCYDTYEQCLQANLDGMEIEEFAEEEIPTFTITIKAETKPKIHTLRFIED